MKKYRIELIHGQMNFKDRERRRNSDWGEGESIPDFLEEGIPFCERGGNSEKR